LIIITIGYILTILKIIIHRAVVFKAVVNTVKKTGHTVNKKPDIISILFILLGIGVTVNALGQAFGL